MRGASHSGCKRGPKSDVLSVGWPELGIANIEMRKIFTRLATEGMELFLKSRGLHSFEMANGQLAWWFGGDTSVITQNRPMRVT